MGCSQWVDESACRKTSSRGAQDTAEKQDIHRFCLVLLSPYRARASPGYVEHESRRLILGSIPGMTFHLWRHIILLGGTHTHTTPIRGHLPHTPARPGQTHRDAGPLSTQGYWGLMPLVGQRQGTESRFKELRAWE